MLDWIVPLASAPSSCSCDARELYGSAQRRLEWAMTPRTRANDRRNPSRTMPLRISMVSLRPTVYRSCNDAMFADPNHSAVFLRLRWDEQAKAMGVAGMKDVLEREERAYVLFARRARTSRQPRARPCGLLRRGRGPQISLGRGAVPAHISGAATVR